MGSLVVETHILNFPIYRIFEKDIDHLSRIAIHAREVLRGDYVVKLRSHTLGI